jgi:hypothetical protein
MFYQSNFQSVISERHARRQLCFDIGCQAHFVADMGDPGMLGPDRFDERKGFFQVEVGRVGAVSQGIDDQKTRAGNFGDFFRRY